MWMNSLNIEDVYLNNMIQDLRDGIVLCKIMDKLAPGKVDMKKVSNKVIIIIHLQYTISRIYYLLFNCKNN